MSSDHIKHIDAICRGEWPAGTRVRCEAPFGWEQLRNDADYVVRQSENNCVRLEGLNPWFDKRRFKPVVRVPMGRGISFGDFAKALFDQVLAC